MYFDYFLYFGGTCTDSRHRLDHMDQMPEELHHLHQRACPSASRDYETPHMWQRCPGKRQLSSHEQQDIPCFTDCSVQYIIDCNRSSHLADKVTADNLRGDNESGIGNSPPRKRPHLDVVDFFTVVFLEYFCYFGHHSLNSLAY